MAETGSWEGHHQRPHNGQKTLDKCRRKMACMPAQCIPDKHEFEDDKRPETWAPGGLPEPSTEGLDFVLMESSRNV